MASGKLGLLTALGVAPLSVKF